MMLYPINLPCYILIYIFWYFHCLLHSLKGLYDQLSSWHRKCICITSVVSLPLEDESKWTWTIYHTDILIDLSYQEEEVDVLKQGESQQNIALKSSLYIKELEEYQQLLFLES